MDDNKGVYAQQPEQEKWPAVDMAYEFVLPSYDLLTGRFEAADTRITTLITIVSGFALGVPLFAQAVRPGIAFSSPLFWAAMALSALAAVAGIVGLVSGRIVLSDPNVLYEKFLHKSPWMFKKDMVYFAGKHFDANARAIERKGKVAVWMTAMMLLSVLLFVAWVSL